MDRPLDSELFRRASLIDRFKLAQIFNIFHLQGIILFDLFFFINFKSLLIAIAIAVRRVTWKFKVQIRVLGTCSR